MAKKRLFLLGGHDLEMEEIKTLLFLHGAQPYPNDDAREGIFFCDKALGWGAKLSDYGECLDFDGEIYGIELIEDITPPPNYRAIDHHGKFWCRPSALEQVAELLDIELNRWQRLVAANDKGHIAALKAMSATPEEIEKIREADMKAQGVTDEEKAQACREAQSVEKRGNVYYVETTLAHTSPLVDLLIQAGKTPLIVVNKERKNLTYYGDGVLKLAGKFQAEIDGNKAYYGGNPPGYFGFAPKYFDHSTYDEAVESIAQTLQEATMHSYHIFMLPFVTRNAIPKPGRKWQEIPYAIKGKDAVHRYNEYTYFHDFVRPVLFNDKPGEGISRYFEYADQKGEYIIEVKGRTYRLELDGIALRHFKNGVGILSFHLINRRYDDFNDILRINDFGRHLYPQYLGDALVEDTINNLLAYSLTLALDGQEPMRESFDHYRNIKTVSDHPHRFPRFIEKLLGDMYDKSDFTPIIDDRMYVICHLMHDRKAQELTNYNEQTDTYAYETSDDWYRFVFVDNDQTNVQNPKMKRELIAKSTYTRWSGYGTLYGITRYSFMLLTKKSDFALKALNRHIRTVYFQMVTLQLAYRAMALNFTKRVTKLLEKGQEYIDIEESTELYYDYLDFINRIYFREATPQEQGIELYEMMKKLMRTERDFKELDAEIAELHNYIDMRSEKSRNDRLETISKIGALFLPPTLLAGMFGMNMIDFSTSPAMAALSVVMIFISGVIGYFIADFKKKKILLGVFLIFALFAPVFYYIFNSPEHTQSPQQQSPVKESHAAKK